ncbi:MAG: PilZ domain-containing protein [Candidatus Omnitrophota bacterium]
MTRIRDRFVERRSFIRLRQPISITYTVAGQDKIHNVVAKDISADGVRFQTTDKEISEGNVLETKLDIPEVANPVHASGKIMWKKKLSLEDNAPFDVGIEFLEIEEDNKNTFLKFLCDLVYNLSEDMKNAKSKKA